MSQPKSFVYRKKGTQLGADGVFRLIAFRLRVLLAAKAIILSRGDLPIH
jgi:hypothetical protein